MWQIVLYVHSQGCLRKLGFEEKNTRRDESSWTAIRFLTSRQPLNLVGVRLDVSLVGLAVEQLVYFWWVWHLHLGKPALLERALVNLHNRSYTVQLTEAFSHLMVLKYLEALKPEVIDTIGDRNETCVEHFGYTRMSTDRSRFVLQCVVDFQDFSRHWSHYITDGLHTLHASEGVISCDGISNCSFDFGKDNVSKLGLSLQYCCQLRIPTNKKMQATSSWRKANEYITEQAVEAAWQFSQGRNRQSC